MRRGRVPRPHAIASYGWISLLTDYGLEDGFAAACHGVIARLAPATRVIDITHLVPPGDIRRGAALLAQTVPHLPPAVHVAVVDPGVGTRRRAVVVKAGGHLLVGPDNGLLCWAADALGGPAGAYEIADPAVMLHPVSATFHGRDVFAPAAARLAAGRVRPDACGPEVPATDLVRLPQPACRVDEEEGAVSSEVVTVDRFGNVQTGVRATQLDHLGVALGDRLRLTVPAAGGSGGPGDDGWEVTVGTTFASVPPGEPVAYVDSAGLVALAVNGGDAGRRLGLRAGMTVRLALTPRG